MVTAPVYVPTARLVAFTETKTEPVVVPLLGVTISQFPLFPVVVAVAVKLTETGVLETVIVWAAEMPPAA